MSMFYVESDVFARAYFSLFRDLGANTQLLLVTFLLSGVLCVLLALVAQLFSRDMVQELEKKSPYECGFFPFDSATRLPFDVHFYVVGIMFLVFDVELVILTTIIILAATMPWSALASVAVFVIILTIGFVYEWACGALRWEAKIPEPLIAVNYNDNHFALMFSILPEVVLYNEILTPVLAVTGMDSNMLFGLALIRAALRFGPPYSEEEKAIEPSIHGIGSVKTRRKVISRAGVVRSWRPRMWLKFVDLSYKFDWKWHRCADYYLLINARPTQLQKAPGRHRRLLRTLFYTGIVPSAHYHLGRLHRWPFLILSSLIIIPAITIPWYWIFEDYGIVLHDLGLLYSRIRWFMQQQTYLYQFYLPGWLQPVVTSLLLYPVAVARAFFDYDWPYMLIYGLLVNHCIWEYAPVSTLTHYRFWTTKQRTRFRLREFSRRHRLDVYEKHFQRGKIIVHPDAGYSDKYSEAAISPVAFFLAALEIVAQLVAPIITFPTYGLLPGMLTSSPHPTVTVANLLDLLQHDLGAIMWLIPERSHPFSFFLIVLALLHGITGVFVPLFYKLMYPRQARLWFPGWNLFVFLCAAYVLYVYVHAKENLISNCINGWPLYILKLNYKLGSPVFTVIVLVVTLFTLVGPIFAWSLSKFYLRYFSGRMWVFTKAIHFAYRKENRAYNRAIYPGVFEPMLAYGQFLANKRAENAEKRQRSSRLWPLPFYIIIFTSLPDMINLLFIPTVLIICPLSSWPLKLTLVLLEYTEYLSLQGQLYHSLFSLFLLTTIILTAYFCPSIVWVRCNTALGVALVVPAQSPGLLEFQDREGTNLVPQWANDLAGLKTPVYVPSPMAAHTVAHNWTVFINFLPEIVLVIAFTALLVGITLENFRDTPKKIAAIACWRAMCVAFVVIIATYIFQLLFLKISSLPAFNGYLFTAVGLTFSKLLVLVTALLVLYSSEKYIREHSRSLIEYAIIIAIGVLLLLILTAANNLMTIFFSIAGFSLGIYILVLFDSADLPAREAGIKYFYLSTISAGFILGGAFLIYYFTSSASYFLVDTFFFINDISEQYRTMCCAAVLLMLFGFFFKLSAVPGHLWAAEVYEGAPAPTLAFFVLPVKVAVFITFLRLLNTALHELSYFWMPFVFMSAAASLIWGAAAAAKSYKLTRFLAYASINQMGFMLLGASVDTFDALRATYIYLFLYVFMTGGFMLTYIHTRRDDRSHLLYISDFGALARTEPSVCWSVAVYLFSMAGIPPLAGFFSKYYILNAVLARGATGLVVVALAVSLVSAYYYLRIIANFWFGETPKSGTSTMLASAELSPFQRTLLVIIESVLWVFCIAGAPLLPAFGLVVRAFWVCN